MGMEIFERILGKKLVEDAKVELEKIKKMWGEHEIKQDKIISDIELIKEKLGIGEDKSE